MRRSEDETAASSFQVGGRCMRVATTPVGNALVQNDGLRMQNAQGTTPSPGVSGAQPPRSRGLEDRLPKKVHDRG